MRDVDQLVAARMALASASECSVCIGAPLAMTEATLVLAEMARRHRIALANDRPVLAVGIVTPQPRRRVLFSFDSCCRAPKRAEGDASRNRRRHDDRAR